MIDTNVSIHPVTKTENGRVITIRPDLQKDKDVWFLLTADWHWDNPKCDRELLEKHLKQAKERDAGVLVFGDALCLMQGRADRRSSKSDIREEHNNAMYIDSVIDTFCEWIEPYRANMTLLTYGNHETSILKHLETDVLQRISAITKIPLGKYDGWVRFVPTILTEDGKDTIKPSVTNLYYHHGSGGGGIVTKGVIQTNRRNAYIDNADIFVSGHIHEAWIMETPKESISSHGTIQRKSVMHVQTGTYKEEFTGSGWHVERGAPPKPLGSWWMRIYRDRVSETRRYRYEFIRTEQ
jgi:UDP-2,3-diacylglucosamine pyrophosphatase LpxH